MPSRGSVRVPSRSRRIFTGLARILSSNWMQGNAAIRVRDLTLNSSFAFVGKLPGDGFQQIGAGDDALEAALLIDDQGELGGGALELVQGIEHRGAHGDCR